MNWINNLFYMGLFTALTGSIAFAVYSVVACVSPVVCYALPQNGGGTVYQGAPV